MSGAPILLPEKPSQDILRNVRPWVRPTATQVRNVVLDGMFLSPHNQDDTKASEYTASMPEAFRIGVRSGRLFDMGHLPNKIIQSESSRAAELFVAGHIGHPFGQPYCLFHTWDADNISDEETNARVRELGVGDAGSLYMVDPLDWHALTKGALPPGTFMICEAQAIRVLGKDMLMIGDIAMVTPGHNPDGQLGYRAQVTRSALSVAYGKDTEAAAAGNLVDPVMACLLLLATDGIEVATIEAPAKLNKQRVKVGKAAIPAHYKVETADYVTALSARYTRKRGPSDGHHASPVPHLRRGHKRDLHPMHGGGTIWVKDAVINLRDPNAPIARAFYQRRP